MLHDHGDGGSNLNRRMLGKEFYPVQVKHFPAIDGRSCALELIVTRPNDNAIVVDVVSGRRVFSRTSDS